MNPSYTAYTKALMSTVMNTLMGIEPPAPKDKKDPNVGAAFAKNVGVQQEEPSEEKEAKVRAHLDKLAAECKQRYLDGLSEIPYVQELEDLAQEATARSIETGWITRQAYTTEEWVQREMARNRANGFNAYMDDTMNAMLGFTHPDNTAKDDHMKRALIETKAQIEAEAHSYPRSDLIVLMEEEMELREAAKKAAIHTGEVANINEG